MVLQNNVLASHLQKHTIHVSAYTTIHSMHVPSEDKHKPILKLREVKLHLCASYIIVHTLSIRTLIF